MRNPAAHELQRTSAVAMRALVTDIRNIDTPNLSQEDVERRVQELIYYYPVKTLSVSLRQHGLWRARKGAQAKVYLNVRELWYPPAGITSMGRLNATGEPVFYCAPRRQIAGLETRPTVDDWVSLVAAEPYDGREILQVYPLGIDRCGEDVRRYYGYRSLGNDPKFRRFIGSDASFNKWRMIDDLLAELLSEDVPNGKEHKYKRTLALRKLFDRMPHHGYMYPSIATRLSGVNFCLPTHVVDAYLRPVGAHVFQLEPGQIANEFFRALPVATSKSLAPDGSIDWHRAWRQEIPPKTRWWHIEGGEGPLET